MSNELTRTAPKRIYLCISDDEEHYNEPFPPCCDDDVPWSEDTPVACCVEYVRADLAARQEGER